LARSHDRLLERPCRATRNACPFLAQMRSADWIRKCLLFGVDRTYRGHHEADAFDPERTCHKMGQLDRTPTCRAGSTNRCLATLEESA
jgi:hypothetical protein